MNRRECLCCSRGTPREGPRICPECGHVFQGNGWDGIDAHWRAKHGGLMSYEAFWESVCADHRKPRFIFRSEAQLAEAFRSTEKPDALKSFTEIYLPDPRQQSFVIYDDRIGISRPVNIEDYYSDIQGIRLDDAVPESVSVHFETARNLLLYSWFVYRFLPVAELHAYASLEYALRERIKEEAGGVIKKGLSNYLEYAVKKGWLQSDQIGLFQVALEARRRYQDSIQRDGEELSDGAKALSGQEYIRSLAKSMPRSRNEIAHGSSYLSNSAFTTLQMCADLINQLFSNKTMGRNENGVE